MFLCILDLDLDFDLDLHFYNFHLPQKVIAKSLVKMQSNTKNQVTPPVAEILCVKNGRTFVVCGFFIK